MYAIVKTGGKQYKVAEGDVLFVEKLEGNAGDVVTLNEVLACTKDGELVFVEKLEANEGDVVTLDQVLAVAGENGLTVGAPVVEGATVTAKVVAQGKAKKVIVYKYKAKKDYRRKQGHRQPYTKIVIEKINA